MKRSVVPLLAWVWFGFWAGAMAQPVIVPDEPAMNLDELGVYAVGYAYRGKPEQQFPLGWSGFFEDRTGVACEPFGAQQGKRAFLLHCPWRNGTGVTFQQFKFEIPASANRVWLRGATALRSESVGKSDGVTFRLFANGRKLLDYHQADDTWRPFAFDLGGERGTTVTVRFEVDPGPRDDASFDYALWGERELVLEGFKPAARIRPPPPPLTLSNLWSGGRTEVAPPSGFPGESASGISNNTAWFRYTGADGTLEYDWTAPATPRDGLFGSLTLRAQMTGDKAVAVPLGTSAALSWVQAATPLASGWSQTNQELVLWRQYRVGERLATVRLAGQLLGKTLALTATCDQPLVQTFDSGGWGPVVRRRRIPVPYYTGSVDYLPQAGLFVNALLDWTASSATSLEGTRANYEALTDGTRVPLRERALFTAAWHLDETLPNPPNPPSPWRGFLADKIILDIWGGSFRSIADNLESLAAFGVTNCVALIHDWQRSGYDNALPMHYPANSHYGGDAAMSHLVAVAARLGIRCALHENYVDYYPNYDFFNTNDIALDSAGHLQHAWFNPGTRIQSFAVKPNAILRLAASQSPEIQRRYQSRANYLDVHSAVPPWFHVDMRAGEAGAGQFHTVWDVHRQLWAYERGVYGGPVFGEGNNHWYWSGCLDGVEAQFGSGWPGNGGFTAPLAVDFDLLKIHPLQFNHGMGYYERWWPSESYHTNWSGLPPLAVLDRYRMQEAIFGHAGFLGGSVYANVPLAWLEAHLLSPVTSRDALARPTAIRYRVGAQWLDATAAAKLNSPEVWNCVQVQYENGLTLTANTASNTVAVGQWLLPQFGWVAQGAGVTAGTVLRDGVVTDFAQTADSLFVNARPACDWELSDTRRILPSVASFEQTGVRRFRAAYRWRVGQGLAKDYFCFVHFCAHGAILAQQDHPLSPPTAHWRAGETVNDGPWNVSLPANLADGDYDWLLGLYEPGVGERLVLQGLDDGSRRIRLGTLRVSDHGASLTFIAETRSPARYREVWDRPRLNLSNRVVDFGDARTDGSFWLRRNGQGWLLQTWPRERRFVVELDRNRFNCPDTVASDGGTASEVKPTPTGSSRWRLPLNGARQYHWLGQ